MGNKALQMHKGQGRRRVVKSIEKRITLPEEAIGCRGKQHNGNLLGINKAPHFGTKAQIVARTFSICTCKCLRSAAVPAPQRRIEED